MVRGIEIAATGMVSIINQNDIIANNLANINTPGFKQLLPTFKNIYDANINEKIDNAENNAAQSIGSLSIGSMLDSTQLDFKQGSFKKTDGPLDLAINGEGFFVVETANGISYTRNGSFTVNEDGDLITRNGDLVLGEGGRSISLNLNEVSFKDIVITKDGQILNGDEEVDYLKIVDFEDKTKLISQGNALFKPVDDNIKPVELEHFTITQGYLENSNAGVVESMINSITGARTYETLSKVIKTTDDTLKKAVNDVGRVRM